MYDFVCQCYAGVTYCSIVWILFTSNWNHQVAHFVFMTNKLFCQVNDLNGNDLTTFVNFSSVKQLAHLVTFRNSYNDNDAHQEVLCLSRHLKDYCWNVNVLHLFLLQSHVILAVWRLFTYVIVAFIVSHCF
ncbi:hypothetical protein KP509_14G027300 [Ceratopteris richardii]|uniref:Uncharacterized protein n=1 Tax=Ceratopteris richardii TaxID=49495 RepID=A0A8T2T8E6_CERRI|nr:hypothetical protein KP509_14G027300 [Ceratopteris richardii]